MSQISLSKLTLYLRRMCFVPQIVDNFARAEYKFKCCDSNVNLFLKQATSTREVS